MNQRLEDIIIEVLNIIGYSNDKQKFAADFINSCKKQAILKYLSTLSPVEQKSLSQQIETADEPKLTALLQNQVDSDGYNKTLYKVLENAFREYLESIKSHLSAIQLQNLQLFFKRLRPTPQTSPS